MSEGRRCQDPRCLRYCVECGNAPHIFYRDRAYCAECFILHVGLGELIREEPKT